MRKKKKERKWKDWWEGGSEFDFKSREKEKESGNSGGSEELRAKSSSPRVKHFRHLLPPL